ncbi:MAG TPA: FecR domain-containing protein [Puia sp.]|nr:FecR domain-containing protein [Puia sp.]
MNEEHPISPDDSNEEAFRISRLISGYLNDELSETEHDELDNWVNANMANQRLFEELTDKNNIDKWLHWKKKLRVEEALERVRSKIDKTPAKRISYIKLLLPYISVAAMLALIISTIIFLRIDHQEKNISVVAHDIAPGKDKATLTLANGKKIKLDSIKSGDITKEGISTITKDDSGKITYRVSGNAAQEISYNVLSTPNGGQFQLTLADGSKVWLNAASSLRYPSSFSGDKRKVELTGEGYFEIAKDASHPFVITAAGTTTEVLGTHFNINAYSDESSVSITLLEGSVRVNNNLVIKPGEQAQVDGRGDILKMAADGKTVTAWKDGEFVFKNTPLKEVMLQVARWYDATISYQDNVSQHFNTTIPREVPVSKLLHLLEATGSVHFSVDNKKITVLK